MPQNTSYLTKFAPIYSLRELFPPKIKNNLPKIKEVLIHSQKYSNILKKIIELSDTKEYQSFIQDFYNFILYLLKVSKSVQNKLSDDYDRNCSHSMQKCHQIIDLILKIQLNIRIQYPLNFIILEKKLETNHSSIITKVICLQYKKKIATCSADGTIKIWDIVSNQLKFIIKGHNAWIVNMFLLNDGLLATCSDDASVKIWKIGITTCKLYKTLKGHSKTVFSALELTNFGLLTGSNDKTLRFWNLNQSSILINPSKCYQSKKQTEIYALTKYQNCEVAVSSGKNINIYWIDPIKYDIILVKTLFGHQGKVLDIRNLNISNKSQMILSAGTDMVCKLWDIQTSNS